MRIALDATYSAGDSLSGVGVYSREILHGLAAASGPAEQWDWFYRLKAYRQTSGAMPPMVRKRLLFDSWGSRAAPLFHGLNQRLPARPFRRQIATFHDLFVLSGDYSTPEFRARFARQARQAAAGADLIIAVSAFTGLQVQQLLGVPATRIRVIHHGITPRAIAEVARKDVHRQKVVLCVGAIQRRKNQAGLVRAFRALPPDWKLVLAGSPGFQAEETLQALADSPCRERILMTGYLSEAELSEWYGRASIFAFPSLDEGFGMPVLEAMQAGIPVVTGNRSALPEIAGNAALQVNPRNEDEISATLVSLATNQRLHTEMVTLGRAHAAQFSWSKAVAETMSVYRELF